MAKPIQFQEYEFELTEITFRCLQARLLFRPGDEFNRRFIGCLGQALDVAKGSVRLHFGGSESNHVHLIVSARTVEDRARFKCHLRTNLSKEIGDLHDWREHLFGRRTRDIPIRDDCLEDRLMYCAAHGVKSNLVEKPTDWPGVPFVRAAIEGTPLKGLWYNRTKLYRAKQNWMRLKNPGKRPNLMQFAEPRFVELSPIPGFDEGLSPEERQAKWRWLVEEAVRRFPSTKPALGIDKVSKANPKSAPKKPKRSPAPKIHVKDPAVRAAWLARYWEAEAGYSAYMRDVLEGKLAPDDFPRELVAPSWVQKQRVSRSD